MLFHDGVEEDLAIQKVLRLNAGHPDEPAACIDVMLDPFAEGRHRVLEVFLWSGVERNADFGTGFGGLYRAPNRGV